MEDHISFFASELLGLSWSLEDETCVNVEVLLFVLAIVAYAAPAQESWNWEYHGVGRLAGLSSNASIQIYCLPCIINGPW
jgi:hypothetical protein